MLLATGTCSPWLFETRIISEYFTAICFIRVLRDFLLPVKLFHASKIAIHIQNVSIYIKKRISKKSLGKDFGKIIHNQKRPNNNNNLPTKTQVLQLLLTLKNAAVEPPCTAPYLIFCCLKCLDLKFKVQFIWHKNSDLATMKSFPNFGEKESGLLFFLNSSRGF